MKDFHFSMKHLTGFRQSLGQLPAAFAVALAFMAIVLGGLANVPTAFATSDATGVVAPLAAAGDADFQLQQVVDVAARDHYFDPEIVTITVGSAVRWINRGTMLHSSTSDDGYWNWALHPGYSYAVRFLAPGVYHYHCSYHTAQGMTGTVVVLPLDGAATPPVPVPTITPLPTVGPGPGPIPAEGAIVFNYFADEAARGQSELYTIDPEGGPRRQLTNTDDLSEAQPSWSPDRRFVAYTASPMAGSTTLSGQWRLRILDVTTGGSSDLTGSPTDVGPSDFEPDWHPGGEWIAYTHVDHDRNPRRSEIRMISPDSDVTRVLVRLDSSSSLVADPNWSPDGQRLVFTFGGVAGGELYQWRPGVVQRLFNHPGWNDVDPAWSPNGRYVAFASGRLTTAPGGARHDIWLLDTTTGQAGAVAGHPTWDLRRPAWSPDGTRIVFNARFNDDPARWALYVVPATGGAVSGPLSLGAEPDWSSRPLVALPTPQPGPTSTPDEPPPFPTPDDPTPTAGATPTDGPPPTFPPPPEPTPTSEIEATTTPSMDPPTMTPSTPTATMAAPLTMIYLPYAADNALMGDAGPSIAAAQISR